MEKVARRPDFDVLTIVVVELSRIVELAPDSAQAKRLVDLMTSIQAHYLTEPPNIQLPPYEYY